ncbi:MAG: hypothetical protein O2826_02970 [Chloroflexi bacterium]|nr:hypothetical protein [Chloroflexota bacterium]MDA1173463.1 hypothetical protein [Chloroflexota bacterium]
MNLFSSEEHARSWPGFDPAFEKNLQPLETYVGRFGGERFRARSSANYMSLRASGAFNAV